MLKLSITQPGAQPRPTGFRRTASASTVSGCNYRQALPLRSCLRRNYFSPPNAALKSCTPVYGSRALTASGLLPFSATPFARRAGASKQITKCSGEFDALIPLGLDFLTFLAATVLVIPVFKSANQSPVLGFLFAGVVMGQLGLFRNVEEIEKLSELGVLFLLFEMGLELTIDKLRALAKFIFGLGFLQMLVCSLAFTAMALPVGQGIMTQFLVNVLNVPASLAAIRSVDEAVVIAVALSLSSSAFVLQLLKERGELSGKFGQATLGILLAQDLATVPFLVLLPLVEGGGGRALAEGGPAAASLLAQLGPTAAKTLGSLAALLIGGRLFLRRIFELVADSKSEETFIAMCLLSVTGASLLTQRLGFSDTLGAFGAGVLLAETNFRTQVEADIQPFRGILLGLFFVTTGSSLDMSLLLREWPLVLTLLTGLLALKITAISSLTTFFGLSKADSIRTGFVLSQGGEFAFVLLALANRLEILPTDLNKLLIIVVVLSMALTPVLTEVGKQAGKWVAARDGEGMKRDDYWAEDRVSDPVVICGFGDVGQAVANLLEAPGASGGQPVPYLAFDLTPSRVQAAKEAGFNVLYGEGSRKKVLHAAGVSKPRAVAIAYSARQRAVSAVESLHESYPGVPIYVRAIDSRHAVELKAAGAVHVVTAEMEAGLALGTVLAQDLGMSANTTSTLAAVLRQDMTARTALLAAALEQQQEQESAKERERQADLQAQVYRMDHSSIDWAQWDEPEGTQGGSSSGSTLGSPVAGEPVVNAALVEGEEGLPGKGLPLLKQANVDQGMEELMKVQERGGSNGGSSSSSLDGGAAVGGEAEADSKVGRGGPQ